MAPSSKLTAFLALAAASPYRDAFAFSPSPQHSRSSVRLSARGLDEDVAVAAVADGWRKASGGAAAFLTGMGIMTQVALADPSAIAPIDQAVQAQSSTTSSNVVLSLGPPSFGGGKSFETMDFSMPSYGEATEGESITTSSAAPPDADNGDAADKAAAKAEAKRAAEAEKAAKKQAAADAKEAAAKEAAAKAAAKAERLAAEKEKQRIVAERLKEESAAKEAAKEEAPLAAQVVDEIKEPDTSVSIPDFKAPDIKVPEFKAPAMPAMPSFSMPKMEMPKMEMPKVDIQVPEMKIPDAPKPAATVDFKAPEMPSFEAPKMPAFEAPKMPSFSMPKVELPKLDVPPPSTTSYNLDTPTFSAPDSSFVDENLEPQEVRDARAAEKNVIFKEAKAEADEAKKAFQIAEGKAKEAKKVFKEAKNEACKTRFGGKFICFRGFGVGY